jgi:OmpA-OmpF porin, OOP family
MPSESPLLWPALVLLVIAVALYTWYWDQHHMEWQNPIHLIWPPPPETLYENAATNGALAVAAPVVPALGTFKGLKLPDGTQLSVPEYGIESKLTAFIEDPSKPVDKDTWFDFDRLLFDSGKATLQPASAEQLNNVAAILKAFPHVHARIGGYTDNTGDADANQRLSEARAMNVMQELVGLGVLQSRLDAKGFGPEHPVADNSTEEGRAKNRRISLRVTGK